MVFISSKFWVSICTITIIVFNTLAVTKAQSEVFVPSKLISILSFEISSNNTIFAIDKDHNLQYSTGSSFKKLPNRDFLQLLNCDNIYAINSESCFLILDSLYEPQMKKVPCNDQPSFTLIYNNVFYNRIGDSLINNTGSPLIILPIGTKDITISREEMYAVGSEGLWIYKNGVWKKYQIPTLPKSTSLLKCASRNGQLAFCDQSKIYYFDAETYDFDEYYINSIIDDLEIDLDGNIWYLSKGNLYYYQRSNNTTNKIKLAAIMIDDMPFEVSSEYQIKGGNNDLEIVIDHRNLIPTEVSSHYYMLENVDNQWQPFNDNTLRYNLAVGNYTFTIKTINGENSSYRNEFDIKVFPLEDLTWLYILGSVIVLLLLLSIILYFRYESQLDKMKSKIKLLQTQASLNQTKTKLNQISINPHFLFNSLNNIQGLLLDPDKTLARKQLRNFSLLMREVLDSNEKNFISIEDDIKFIKQYLELEKMNHNNSFDYQIIVDQKLNLSTLIPPMITQIPIENAIVHGMKGKSSGGHITLHYKTTIPSIIEVVIEDNGNGIILSKTNHTSKGTKIIQERLKNVSNPYILENITKDGKELGCRAILKIPIKN